jgi:mono/diheme cytochrome c family protein
LDAFFATPVQSAFDPIFVKPTPLGKLQPERAHIEVQARSIRSHKLKVPFATLFVFCLAAFTLAARAQDSGTDTYKAKCQMCHGADGLGNTPVGKMAKIVSLKDPTVVSATDPDLFAVVKNGKNKMPANNGKLTDDQITAVLAYIRTLQK